ncbi:hypothetical protein C672_1695 [[Clostridium] bifermentans ATCC 638]|uniref:Uncharacterized protein n=1 Tax=Paraclostridium bifermentans ATCC 638 = DSM 14991 TaxID=1233171 RepID=T4VPR5_PARBF|nr:hypothetical protein [Paraclostridium bifermentans]EQK42751.1 hypothetical protein C672_1695 [[Clostridium] bifermentans ATCC 638] [Paraclostridium bifermentans ATCC 638 = DSM 14991]RIZ58431.1 hypothetical protein CHH45_11435 [Paraclostridium bifermentans]UAG19550.1 hypothetical protein KXZ80_07525 [Paraclostridium bifermentans]
MLKKFSIIILLTLIIFTSNANSTHALSFVPPSTSDNQYIKDLEIIDDSMYLLIKTIIMGNYKDNEINKSIKFIETLIEDLNIKASKLPQKDNAAVLAVESILNFYKVSLIRLQSYLETKDPDNLMDAINIFSLASSSSNNLSEIIGEAGN